MGEWLHVRIYADVPMSYEDFLRMDDAELREFVVKNSFMYEWKKEGAPGGRTSLD